MDIEDEYGDEVIDFLDEKEIPKFSLGSSSGEPPKETIISSKSQPPVKRGTTPGRKTRDERRSGK